MRTLSRLCTSSRRIASGEHLIPKVKNLSIIKTFPLLPKSFLPACDLCSFYRRTSQPCHRVILPHHLYCKMMRLTFVALSIGLAAASDYAASCEGVRCRVLNDAMSKVRKGQITSCF